MAVKITGFDQLIRRVEQAPDTLAREVTVRAAKIAERLASAARDGVPVETGHARNSIHSYVDAHGDEITAGAMTANPVAIFHELGTGPVGQAGGYPGAAELGITYRPDGWKYQSEEEAARRGEPFHKWDGKEGYGGYVYTEGVPPKAFLYNAMKSMEGEIAAQMGGAVKVAIKEATGK